MTDRMEAAMQSLRDGTYRGRADCAGYEYTVVKAHDNGVSHVNGWSEIYECLDADGMGHALIHFSRLTPILEELRP